MRVIKVKPSSYFDFRALYPTDELMDIIPKSVLEDNNFSLDTLVKEGYLYIRNDIYISSVKEFKDIITDIKENSVIEQNGLQLVIFSNEAIEGDDIKAAISKYNAIKADDLKFIHINDNLSLHKAIKEVYRETILKHIANGVMFTDTTTCKISPLAVIEARTIIKSNSTILGKTTISESCIIGPNATIESSVIGENTKVINNSLIKDSILGTDILVQNSTVLESKIGNFTTVGPYAYIRPNSILGSKVKIGDFVEVKNSNIGSGSKSSHLAYIGDSDIGENVNIGCGVVFVNYDGKNKYRSTVDSNSFIGCNSNIISPVHVGSGAFVAAGSTITEDVNENQLAIARQRQTNKDDWTLKNKVDK